jgi:biotin carboxyl carrier protein
MSYSKDFDHDGERLRVSAKALGGDRYEVRVGDRLHQVTAIALPDGRCRFELDGTRHEAAAARAGKNDVHVRVDGRTYRLFTHTGRRGAGHGLVADGVIEAPMTGTVLKILVAVGDEVTAARTVAVVSAMKMEHKLLAGIDGVVAEVACVEGATVDQGALILRVE